MNKMKTLIFAIGLCLGITVWGVGSYFIVQNTIGFNVSIWDEYQTEETIYDGIVACFELTEFDKPSTVELKRASSIQTNDGTSTSTTTFSNSYTYVDIEISFENSLNVTLSRTYRLYLDEVTKTYKADSSTEAVVTTYKYGHLESIESFTASNSLNVTLINEELVKYYSSNGWTDYE